MTERLQAACQGISLVVVSYKRKRLHAHYCAKSGICSLEQ
uniref:Uncharacterized protein n=1 Tax=Anguilla anguilla TaxID=7936 RepID=A0A0E9UDJ8_ANGAN